MNLKEQLDKLSAEYKTEIPEPVAKLMNKALLELSESGIVNRVLKEGQRAPSFALPNAVGKIVSLEHLLTDGPVVLTFYRGDWCPFCNLTLRALEKSLPEIRSENATLVAVSPQLPEASAKMAEMHELTFEVLSDFGSNVAHKFGIAYKLSQELLDVYTALGLDLVQFNGDDSGELPLSATFIINRNGLVAYSFVDVDYKKRIEPSEIVSVLRNLKE
jgi:peroxiredoxin